MTSLNWKSYLDKFFDQVYNAWDKPTEPQHDRYLKIQQKQYKELPIIEPDAVVDPRAVMVHVEYTPVAGWAVMASFWFEDVAD